MPDVTVDPRLQNLIQIDGWGEHRPIVLGSPVGSDTALLIAETRALAQVASRFRRTALEVAEYIRMPSERHGKLSAAAVPLVHKMREAAGVYREESSRIHKTRATATAVPAWSERTPMHVLMADMELAKRFHSMEPPQRVKMLAELERAPQENKRMFEAVLRADIAITGLAPAEHHRLREAGLRAFEPELWQNLETEGQQLALARRALHVASQLVRTEAPGAWTEATSETPDLATFVAET